jgi:hypothetical protein
MSGAGRSLEEDTDPVDLPRLLRLGGKRRGEKPTSQGADERTSVHTEPPFGRTV